MTGPVLIGVAGTSRDVDALALGHELAELLNADEIVTTAVTATGQGPVPPAEEHAILRRRGRETIERALTEADRVGIEAGRAVQLSSSPADGLTEQARSSRAAVLVVGSSHRGELGRVFAGTVGIDVLAEAPCPVAFAPAGFAARGSGPVRRIGVGYDGTPESEAVLDYAVSLSKAAKTRLRIVSMAHPLQPVRVGYGMPSAAGNPADEVTESIRRAVSDAVRRKSAETPVEGRVLEFSGARLTDESDLDAMVVGCHRRGRLARFLSGSVSAETVHTASYPVIVVPFDGRSIPRPRSGPALATL